MYISRSGGARTGDDTTREGGAVDLLLLLCVSPACPPSPGLLELPSLGPDHGLDMAGRGAGGAELPVGLPGGPLALQQDGVGPSGSLQGKLVERQDAAAVGQDALAGLLGHAEGGDLSGKEIGLMRGIITFKG